MAALAFDGRHATDDFGLYVRRAVRLDESGAMRLQVGAGVLAAWVGVLPGRGLANEGLTLGLRTMQVVDTGPDTTDLDVCVPLAGLRDRLARDPEGPVRVPPQELTPGWAGVTPPRSGWEPVGTVDVELLRRAAQDGIREIAAGTPEGAGSLAVATLRATVWGRPVAGGVPAGAAFAAHALGFLVGDLATWHRAGPWGRLSTPVGHVLTR